MVTHDISHRKLDYRLRVDSSKCPHIYRGDDSDVIQRHPGKTRPLIHSIVLVGRVCWSLTGWPSLSHARGYRTRNLSLSKSRCWAVSASCSWRQAAITGIYHSNYAGNCNWGKWVQQRLFTLLGGPHWFRVSGAWMVLQTVRIFTKKEADLREDPRGHFAIDNWRWGDWAEISQRIHMVFWAYCLQLPLSLNQCFLNTWERLGMFWDLLREKQRILGGLYSTASVFCSIGSYCRSVSRYKTKNVGQLYKSQVVTGDTQASQQICIVNYLFSFRWTLKMKKPAKKEFLITFSAMLIWKLIFFV